MKYNHVVKRNGVWYPAGADVPIDAGAKAVKEEVALEPAIEETPEPEITRTQIQQMRKADLLVLAKKVGIQTDEDTTGAWLKTELIKHFNL